MDILIVEGESATVSDLKPILGKLGHKVVAVVSNGEDAIKCAGNLNPDLILINIKYGAEAERIDDLYNIPLIFVTVFIKNCLNKSLQLKEDAVVLSKPITEEHLRNCIKRAVFNK